MGVDLEVTRLLRVCGGCWLRQGFLLIACIHSPKFSCYVAITVDGVGYAIEDRATKVGQQVSFQWSTSPQW